MEPTANPAPQSEPAVGEPTVAPQQPVQPVAPLVNPVQPMAQPIAPVVPVPPVLSTPSTPAAQTAPTQSPQPPGAASLNTTALQGYETARKTNNVWEVIKADPELKKQLIIGVGLLFTVILGIVGIFFIGRAFIRGTGKANAQSAAASRTMFNRFAQDNNMQLQENVVAPLAADGRMGLLDQMTASYMQEASQAPKAVGGLLGFAVEPAAVGSLPGGMQYALQIKHLPVHLHEDNAVAYMGVRDEPFTNHIYNASGVLTGSALDTVSRRMMQSYKNDSIFFTVTIDRDANSMSTTPDDIDMSIDGEYVYASLTVSLGDKLVPHILLVPLVNGFGLPLAPTAYYPLTLEGDFNKHFGVLTVKGYETEVLQILDPGTMQHLIDDLPEVTVEFVGNQLNLLLPVRPYTNPVTLADSFARLHAVAAKLEPWLQRHFATWRFSPQPLPYQLTVRPDVDASQVARDINTLGPDHVAWDDNKAALASEAVSQDISTNT